ncbi:aldehyde ferredoxin oxidoreductase family protein [Chloroflexota bacterium]
MKSYLRKILRVDLSEGTIAIEELDEKTLRSYIGGSGLAAKIIWDETTADTEPLSEENVLTFMIGPLTGTPVPMGNRYSVAAISPLTGIWGEAHAGGTWGYTLGHTPYMGIVFKGQAKRPVYLWIDDAEAKIVEASHLWGKDTYEVDELLKRDRGEKVSTLSIGRAGEKLVKLACVMSDGRGARAAGRCGLGAVMGSKKLKAIAVRGTKRPPVYEENKLRESIRRHFPKTFDPKGFKEGKYDNWASLPDRCCVKNWTLGKFDGFGYKVVEIEKKGQPTWYCSGCPVSCSTSLMLEGQRHFHGEFTIPFGSNCLIDNMDALVKAYRMCNRYGLDTISTGSVIALAMELYEKGLITEEDVEGTDLRWGNAEAMLETLRKIGEREGFGELLGQGVRALAQRVGGMAPEYAMHVKGLEFAKDDPRCYNSYAIQYATANRGADHLGGIVLTKTHPDFWGKHAELYSLSYPEREDVLQAQKDPFASRGKGRLAVWSQDFNDLFDALGVCVRLSQTHSWIREPIEPFVGIRVEQYAEWLSYITGWDMDVKEILKAGERIFNLKRAINIRRGIRGKDDTLPRRMLIRKKGGEGPRAENLPHLGLMINEYYACRGWDEDGIPTKDKLVELGLGDLADELPVGVGYDA